MIGRRDLDDALEKDATLLTAFFPHFFPAFVCFPEESTVKSLDPLKKPPPLKECQPRFLKTAEISVFDPFLGKMPHGG